MATNREGTPQSFKALLVWQKGMDLAKSTYRLTQRFPAEEKFGLVPQMRRCAVSIPSNIAEGPHAAPLASSFSFISHAEGSLAEPYTQLKLAVDLTFCSANEAAPLFSVIEDLRKMLNSLRQKLVTRH